MKIALVYDVLYPDTIGGVEKRIFEIGTRLAARGHEVHLFPMSAGGTRGIVRRDGLIIHQVCRPIGLYTGGRRSVFQALWYSIHLFPVLLRERLDIIDCQNFPYFPVIVSRIVGFFRHTPGVFTWHEVWGPYWYQYLGIAGLCGRIIEKIALSLSDIAIAVSRHTAERMKLEGWFGEPYIVPNGITLADILAVTPNTEPVDIIYVARFIPEKHPELLVEAIRILVEEFPALSCLMIGDGPLLVETRDMVETYGLSDNISLPGFISDYRQVIGRMKAAQVFVLPSEREGFGIVCIEALACGLPLITVRHPMNAASDHVLPGCGYIAGCDPVDIAAGIRMFLNQSPDLKHLQSYVLEHDWDIITCSLEGLYHEIRAGYAKNRSDNPA